MTGITDLTGPAQPACRQIRQLLGVYIVGAIDPAERAYVDAHLADCRDCREELAGLAGLPALLGRVPLVDAERLSEDDHGLPDMDEPPAELLNSLLRRVAGRQRTRRWRSILALAAAVAIAAGSGAAVVQASHSGAPAVSAQEVVRASNAHVTTSVAYSATPWGGTTMRVTVKGIRPGTACAFWVRNAAGRWTTPGGWIIGPGYGEHWYSVSSTVPANSVRGFRITSAGQTLLSIPAA
jgi:Putative zinc-finger